MNTQLLSILDDLIPLVDGLADKLRILLWGLLLMLAWFGYYLLQLNHWGWGSTAVVATVIAIPLFILARIYWSLRSVQELPNTLDDVTDDMQLAWKEAKGSKRGAANVFSQAKNLYQIRGLLGGAGDMLGQYVSVGALVNPFFLLLGVLALLATFVIGLVAVGTILSTIF